jgi:uncharacterized protein YceK
MIQMEVKTMDRQTAHESPNSTGDEEMNKLIIALTTLVLSGAGTVALADDVKTGDKTTETQGRQLEEDVRTGGQTTDTQGRKLDEEVKTGGQTTDTQGRRLDEVKEGGQTTGTQGRKLDEKDKKE